MSLSMDVLQRQDPIVATNPQEPMDYHSNAIVQQERALENLSSWSFNPSDRVLDIGSGNGKITANIAAHVPYGRVVGLDIDQEMNGFANTEYPHGKYPNLLFVQGNACELTYEKEFEKVTCFATLSWIHIDCHAQIMKGIARALVPGGKALLRMSAVGDRPFNCAVDEIASRKEWCSFFAEFESPAAYQSKEMLRTIISEAGLNICRIEDATKQSRFINDDTFCTWLMTWVPHRNCVPENKRTKFIEEVVIAYCQLMGFAEEIIISLPALLVEVEKPI